MGVRLRLLTALAAALLAMTIAVPRSEAREAGAPDGSPTAQCLRAAEAAGQLNGIPAGLMSRLAQVESGRPVPGESVWRPWPWTIDADGAAIVFATKAQAVTWAELAPRHKVKFLDVGCLQVNLQYHPNAFADLDQAFDPWANADYAAHFLRSLYEQAGHDWSVAVGWYHSQTPELAYDYRTRVAALGQGIIAGLPPGPLAARLRAVGLVNVPLAGGGTLRLQLNREPAGIHPVRASPCAVAAALGPLMVHPPKVVGCVKQVGPRRVAVGVLDGP